MNFVISFCQYLGPTKTFQMAMFRSVEDQNRSRVVVYVVLMVAGKLSKVSGGGAVLEFNCLRWTLDVLDDN